MINNRQNGRRRGRGGQQARNGQPGNPHSNSRVDNRQRGNAAQLLEKYKTLARDAQMQGDRVNTEYYLQFADHYFRVLSENRSRFEEQRRPRDEFGQDYGTEDDADQANRAFSGNDAEEGWDDGDDDMSGQSNQPTPRYEQPQRAAPAQAERREREAQPQSHPQGERRERDGQGQGERRDRHRDGGDAQDQGERRDRNFQPRERRPRAERPNGGQANGNTAAAATEGARAPIEPVPTGASVPTPAETPRIEFDRLPPALTTTAAPSEPAGSEAELPLVLAEPDAEAAPVKRRRPRKPKAAPDGSTQDAAPADA